MAAVVLSVGAHAASVDELDDAAARLQYAFYTEDVHSLENVLLAIETLDIEEPANAKEYQLAYGNWKLAQLYEAPDPQGRSKPRASGLANKAAGECQKHARAAIQQDARMAEAYALDAICDGMSQGFLRSLGGGNCEKHRSLKTALELAPADPRVQLISALCASNKAEAANNVPKWQAVVAAFESAPPVGPGKPDWGHVEALTQLGESYLQRGQAVPAREAFERALVLAPDYREAQRMLEAAASRPR
jgi:tetratricopeptide (TPR) repeat protein